MSGLFRTEVLEHRQQAWLGGIQLIRPLSLNVLTIFVLIVASIVAAYLSVGQYTRKARLSGYLVPDRGVIRLLAAAGGARSLERHAVEGQAVRRATCCSCCRWTGPRWPATPQAAVKDSLDARQRSLQASCRQQPAQLGRRSARPASSRLADMRRELAQMAAEAALQRERLALAQQSAGAASSRCAADNFVSHAQVQTKSEEVLGPARASCRRWSGSAQRSCARSARWRRKLRELPLRAQAQQGEIERDLALLSQESAESEARRRIVVRAPHDGVVAAVLAEPGQSVSPTSALASLLPADAQLQAQLYAPSSAVGFVRPEQPVLLRYQAFPYQKFGHHAGRVLQVSRTPLQASELAGLPLPSGRRRAASRAAVPHHRGARAAGRCRPTARRSRWRRHAARGRRAARPAPPDRMDLRAGARA